MRQHFWWHCKAPAGGERMSLAPPLSPGPQAPAATGGQDYDAMSPRAARSPAHNSPAIRKPANIVLVYHCLLVIQSASEHFKTLNRTLSCKERNNFLTDTDSCDVRRSLTWAPPAELRNLDPRAGSQTRPETWPRVSDQWIAPPGRANIESASGFYREIFHCDNFIFESLIDESNHLPTPESFI